MQLLILNIFAVNVQDTLMARDSFEFRLDFSSDFQQLEDLEPYQFYEIYLENIRKK